MSTLFAWRHPKVAAAEGRCIGVTDLEVEPHAAQALADAIVRHASGLKLRSVVVTSALRRSVAVGALLSSVGWEHRIDAALNEASFGRWEGLPWSLIGPSEIDAWVADFLRYAPGGGETAADVLARVRDWRAPDDAQVIVTHGGWLSAALWLRDRGDRDCTANDWPRAPAHSSVTALDRSVFNVDRRR